MSTKWFKTTFSMLSLAFTTAFAGQNLVVNGSFEEGVLGDIPKGWKIESFRRSETFVIDAEQLVYLSNDSEYGIPDGENFVVAKGFGRTASQFASGIRLYQEFPTRVGATYEISFFSMDTRHSGTFPGGMVRAHFNDAQIPTSSATDWHEFKFQIVSRQQHSRVAFESDFEMGTLGFFVLDDVSIYEVSPVPEARTGSMLVVGLLLYGLGTRLTVRRRGPQPQTEAGPT